MSFRNSPSHGENLWSKEDIATLIRLWDEGHSGGEIGKLIGKARSACCAKVWRLRNAGHVFKRVHEPQPERGAGTRRGRGPTHARSLWQPPRQPTIRRPPKPLPEPPAILDTGNAKPWLERAFGECAFPVSGLGADTISCCAQTKGKTYCRAHRAIMYAPPKPRASRAAA